ncbi:nuclear transport factor 2 family protein [Massilia sp. CCM 9210]|uniref:nuclear transport factor 2 family protein n=1 Tax=Massilia scottii TaxID=3057166 RepID=UPI002796C841|nr:nuclear transport factor 2 family protein [Massilia sp. CCM 9210]MDQ1817899.1 nuclear transport factor 2 family protein [Massilia sp. CCM 9210]
MKNTFIKTLFFLAVMTGLGATAQAEVLPGGQQVNSSKAMSKPTYVQDYQAIVEVLGKYSEGCKQARSSIIKPAFSAQATIFGVDAKGKLAGGPIQELFNAIDNPPFRPSPEAQGVIVSIDIVGTSASARIDTNDVSGFSFTDFFHLLKVDGKWTVVSKIYHTHVAP